MKFNDKNEIADDRGIKGLMAVLQPWPAATIGFNLIPYFNSSLSEKKETADARVATIRNTYGARVLAVYAPADASTKPLSISSSLRETAATSPGWVRLDLSPDPSFQPAPYSVAAHEVGHMFGNVDFYRDDQRNVAEKETARDGEDGGEGPSDIERALARSQKAMFQLVAAAHMTDFSPAVGVIDDSIMSMGTRVLPSHYLPFWEVLAKLTSADIPAEDWVITQ